MSSRKRKKDQEKMHKELVVEYQRAGYSEKESKKYASQEMEELMSEKKMKPLKRKIV